jgi:hypothetical protein
MSPRAKSRRCAPRSVTPELVNAVGPHPYWGGRPQVLHLAIEGKRHDMFDLLLAAGADVNGTNQYYEYWSPLMLTLSEDSPGMRAELLRHGARIGLPEALMMGDDAMVRKPLAPGSGALPRYAPNGGSILAFARTPFAIDRLLELGAPAHQADRWGSTPIDALSRLGVRGTDLVNQLLQKGFEARPEFHARSGDQRKLEALIAADPALVRNEEVLREAAGFGQHDLVA